MARVLLGWELGGGLGHVGGLLPIAEALAHEGHEPILVVKNLSGSLPLLRGKGFRLLQAPVWTQREPPTFKAGSFADILAIRGYADVDELEAQVNAWQNLIDLVRPAFVVSDYSPTLNLAAFGVTPLVAVGNAFGLPPVDALWFPSFANDVAPVVPQERILENIHEVQKRRGRPQLRKITDLFAGAGSFIYTFPDLDPYGRLNSSSQCFIGPYERVAARKGSGGKMTAFVYLAAEFPGALAAIGILQEAGIGGRAYFRGASEDALAKIHGQGFQIDTAPPSLANALGENAILIHHGGATVAAVAFAAGRPQICLPRFLEQDLTAQRLETLGAGMNLSGKISTEKFTDAARRILTEPGYAETAMRLAEGLHERGPWRGLGAVLDHCGELL